MASYLLEQYLERVASLPGDLERNFTLMQDLDTKAAALVEVLDGDCQVFLEDVGSMSRSDRRTQLKEIQGNFEQAMNYSEDKVSLAVQIYETVDKHIRQLDADLSKMDAETADAIHPSDRTKASVEDMPVDPNEPTYCICHQVSYGEMIGCDNKHCPLEWFHYACVGLTERPRDKSWYCPLCREGHDSKRLKSA
eukprot:m.170030 g.170030  ORF g.170030 m.170030 type:complete len:194 (+) comp16678_c0_seq4:155-736(+)